MSEVAYVAALKREVAELVKGWKISRRTYSGRNFDFYENGDRVLVCGGIGPDAARRATQAVIELYHPKKLVSVGFVGALDSAGRVGDISVPALVVDARDGSRIQTGCGNGVLVSFGSVAAPEQKRKLASAFGAQTVDMEAASVAKGAQAHGISFCALKAVSDELEFSLFPMDEFIDAAGNFHAIRFIAHAAFRPTRWPSVVRLARNARIASHVLSERLRSETNQNQEP